MSITTGTAKGSGEIHIITGDGSGWMWNSAPCVPPNIWPEATYQGREIYGCGPQAGYVEFEPQYFQEPKESALGQPLCIFPPNMASNVAFLNAANSDLHNQDFIMGGSIAAEYFQDSDGAWHVGVTYFFEGSAAGVPNEIDFICPKNHGP